MSRIQLKCAHPTLCPLLPLSNSRLLPNNLKSSVSTTARPNAVTVATAVNTPTLAHSIQAHKSENNQYIFYIVSLSLSSPFLSDAHPTSVFDKSLAFASHDTIIALHLSQVSRPACIYNSSYCFHAPSTDNTFKIPYTNPVQGSIRPSYIYLFRSFCALELWSWARCMLTMRPCLPPRVLQLRFQDHGCVGCTVQISMSRKGLTTDSHFHLPPYHPVNQTSHIPRAISFHSPQPHNTQVTLDQL